METYEEWKQIKDNTKDYINTDTGIIHTKKTHIHSHKQRKQHAADLNTLIGIGVEKHKDRQIRPGLCMANCCATKFQDKLIFSHVRMTYS